MSLPPITNLPSVNSSLADSSRVRELFSQPGCLSAEVTAMKKHPNVSLVREAGDDGREERKAQVGQLLFQPRAAPKPAQEVRLPYILVPIPSLIETKVADSLSCRVSGAGDDGRDKSVRPRWGSFSSSLGPFQNPEH
jgi:hypothetical protein